MNDGESTAVPHRRLLGQLEEVKRERAEIYLHDTRELEDRLKIATWRAQIARHLRDTTSRSAGRPWT